MRERDRIIVAFSSKLFTIFGLVGLLSIFLVSCEKNTGKGGTSTVKGRVVVQEYNKELTEKKGDPYPGQDVDVYIVYGEDEIYGDKFKTGWDGKFEFKYLQNGQYIIYVLSKSLNNTETNEKIRVLKVADITDKNQVVDVGDLNIID